MTQTTPPEEGSFQKTMRELEGSGYIRIFRAELELECFLEKNQSEKAKEALKIVREIINEA